MQPRTAVAMADMGLIKYVWLPFPTFPIKFLFVVEQPMSPEGSAP